MADNKVRIGLVGFGTVGAGVADLLLNNTDSIKAKTSLDLELATVVDLDTATTRPVTLPEGMLTDDINTVLNDDTIDIAVELIGGTTIAKDLQLKMIQSGKHVVTANKALLAKHGTELYAAAKQANRCIAFEASCAGGIPIVSAIRTGLAANRINAIYGILNGTCNYILTNMTQKGLDFKTALSQAQQKGYAEADPTLDINGHDSAHKLAILAGLAFGCEIKLEDVSIEGIESVSIDDIHYGLEMGYVLKLLAIGEKDSHGKISLRVHPSFLHEDNPLARVDGPFNAISVFAHAVGHTMYYGRGAGMMPTASAVVADIIEVANGNSQRIFDGLTLTNRKQIEPLICDIDSTTSRFYVKLMAKDKPGVFATYGKILGKHEISISGALQHEGTGPDNTVPVVITTHPVSHKSMFDALTEFANFDIFSGKPVCIRIVDIPEDSD